MAATILPDDLMVEEIPAQQIFITKEGRIPPSIYLEASPFHFFSESILHLNDERQVQQAQDLQMRSQLLKLHGIPYAPDVPIFREYLSMIFQTRTLVMYRSIAQKTPWPAMNRKEPVRYRKIQILSKDTEVEKVQIVAIRALYALGLDYGVVKCGVSAGKKIWVLQVLPSLASDSTLKSLFMEALSQYRKQVQGPKIPLKQIMVGADPEFILQSPEGHLLMASKYFPIKGKIGCDAISMGHHTYKPLVEIRPDPAVNPRIVVARMYQILFQEAAKMSDVPAKWLAGAMPYHGFPLGGHIHFSGLQPNFKMLRALDNYLALPLVLVEDAKGKVRRPKYGFLGDFRYQEYGGFEYRTLPSWLVSPILTKGVLAIAKVVVANYPTLQYDPLASPAVQQAYYEGDKAVLQSWIQTLWHDLQSCEDFHMYHTDLHDFYHYLTSGNCWEETQDFRVSWKLPPYQTTGKQG
jgi:hypothetical protein